MKKSFFIIFLFITYQYAFDCSDIVESKSCESANGCSYEDKKCIGDLKVPGCEEKNCIFIWPLGENAGKGSLKEPYNSLKRL